MSVRNVPGGSSSGLAPAKRQHRREVVNQRSDMSAGVRAAPAIVRSLVSVSTATRRRCCMSAALEPGFERAVRRIHHREHAGEHRQRDRRGDDQLDQREPATRDARQNAFPAFAATKRASDAAAQVGDEHLQNPRVVATVRQRIDRPAAKIGAAGGRRRTAAERVAGAFDEVGVARRRCGRARRRATASARSPPAGRSSSIFCCARTAAIVVCRACRLAWRRERDQLRERGDADGDDAWSRRALRAASSRACPVHSNARSTVRVEGDGRHFPKEFANRKKKARGTVAETTNRALDEARRNCDATATCPDAAPARSR